MGNRTGLWLDRETGEEMVFEANNALPLFWCAAFRPADPAPWAAIARASVLWDAADGTPEPRVPSLELRLPWDVARANLRAALARAPARVPALAPRLAAFAAALEGEAARLGATGLVLDAAEWVNFYSQEQDAADALGTMIAVWHGDDPPRPPTMHWMYEVDGIATDPAIRLAQGGWPAVPLAPLATAPPTPGRRGDAAWVAALVVATIGAFAATGSAPAALAAFATVAAIFLWWIIRRG